MLNSLSTHFTVRNKTSYWLNFVLNDTTDNVLEYFEDGSVATTELESLRDKYTEYITKKVDASLEGSKFELDDKRTLDMVVGVGNRLESVSHNIPSYVHPLVRT